MTCLDELYLNDEGTSIEFEVYECDDTVDPPVQNLVNISSATVQAVNFLKPDGTTINRTGEFLTDGTDGITRYITVSGDLDVTGPWKAQAVITLPTGKWATSIIEFQVLQTI